ncbi:MAG: hypothetical protein C0467_29845 [Planctomycetaceae bacterium]|nr:hypothetical protein [Planctomycetaceae bacterium]
MVRTVLLLGAMLAVTHPSAWGEEKKAPATRTLQADAKLLASVKEWAAEDVPAVVDGKKVKVNFSLYFMAKEGKSGGDITLSTGSDSFDVSFELVELNGKRFIKVPPIEFLKNPGFMLEYTVEADKITVKKSKASWGKTVIDFGDGVSLKPVK